MLLANTLSSSRPRKRLFASIEDFVQGPADEGSPSASTAHSKHGSHVPSAHSDVSGSFATPTSGVGTGTQEERRNDAASASSQEPLRMVFYIGISKLTTA